MYPILVVFMVIIWAVFVWSVLLMSPKWGIGMWIWGMSWGNEYWSKKSLETKFKKIALVTWVVFVLLVVMLPYIKS